MAATRYLFKGSVANAATQYVGVPISPSGTIGVQIAWLDATSSATITLEYTDYDASEAPVSAAGSAWEWVDSGETIDAPAASAAGAGLVSLAGVPHRRARLKIVAAANSLFEILEGNP